MANPKQDTAKNPLSPNIFPFLCFPGYTDKQYEGLLEAGKKRKGRFQMTLNELTYEQKVALAAMVEAVAILDGDVSEAEGRKIGGIALELGEEEYRGLLDEAESRFADVDALKEFLGSVKDQEARDLIYGTVLDEAMAEPTVDVSASELLKWLATEWQVQVQIEDV
jgi:hypothetical protein